MTDDAETPIPPAQDSLKNPFTDLKKKSWELSQPQLEKWQGRLVQILEDHGQVVNRTVEDLSFLYGQTAPEKIDVSLQYFPRPNTQKGEPINNLVERDRLPRNFADVLYWVSETTYLPTDTPEDIQRIDDERTSMGLAGIIHEAQHALLQDDAFESLVAQAETQPEVVAVLEKLSPQRGEYLHVTNELLTTFLEKYAYELISSSTPQKEATSTKINLIVDEEKSSLVFEQSVRADIEDWQGLGPYTQLRQSWEKTLGNLPDGYQSAPDSVDHTTPEADRKYAGANIYALARKLNTSLVKEYIITKKPIDIDFIKHMYQQVDQLLVDTYKE